MKIIHVVERFDLNIGGLRTAVKGLISNVHEIKHIILTSTKEEKDEESFVLFNSNNAWSYHGKLSSLLNSICNKNSIIHIHGVWLYPHFKAAHYARKNKMPYIITAHGMLEPFHMKKNMLIKWIYSKLILNTFFKNATIIHTITQIENKNIQILFPKLKKNQLTTIPNAISMKNREIEKTKETEKYFLFIGRLAPQKGLDILIEALYQAKLANVKLKIAGSIDGPSEAYYLKLTSLINQFNLKSHIEFIGFVKGNQKDKIIANAFALVTPSNSEAIGIVNLEGALQATPVITTYNTGLSPDWNLNGGRLINPNVKELKDTIINVWNWSEQKRNDNGKRLHLFVQKNYSWKVIKEKWINLYYDASKL